MHFVTVHTGFSHIRKLSVTSNTWDYGNTVLISSGIHITNLTSSLMAVITFLVRSITLFGNGFYQVSLEFPFLASMCLMLQIDLCTEMLMKPDWGCTVRATICLIFPWVCPFFFFTPEFLTMWVFDICRNVWVFAICYFWKKLHILIAPKCKKKILLLFKEIIIIIIAKSKNRNTLVQQLTFRISQKTSRWNSE